MRSRIALPLHSAFTLPHRIFAVITLALSKNLSVEAISFRSSFAPPLPEAKRLKLICQSTSITGINSELAQSHARFLQNQNQFDLEFSIAMNMQERARERAKLEFALRVILFTDLYEYMRILTQY